MATNGLVLITPTSTTVDGTGASATIGARGSVTFTSCTSLSLNGVFSSTYDNYIINLRYNSTKTSKAAITFRLRLTGIDNQTASAYVSQLLRADSTTVSGSRTTAAWGIVGAYETDQVDGVSVREGLDLFVYGPNLAQATAWRSVTVNGDTGAGIDDYAGTHNQATGYDGFTILGNEGGDPLTGFIKVYGLVK